MASNAQTESETIEDTGVWPDDSETIGVDPATIRPSLAWKRIRLKRTYKAIPPVKRLPASAPVTADNVRFVCISDTHSRIECRDPSIVPFGDVLLHAGDFTMRGEIGAVQEFNTFLGKLPHKHKVVIAGNHELTFDLGVISEDEMDEMRERKIKSMTELLTNCIYLQDSAVNINGINIYGAPWMPEYGCPAFGLHRGQSLLDKWNLIPTDTDILMTHPPPVGYGDKTKTGHHVGCVELLNTVQRRVKPKFHVFGHIHEAYGMYNDGTTTFINASSVVLGYRLGNDPILFDYPLPEGCTKDIEPQISEPETCEVESVVRRTKRTGSKSKVVNMFKKFKL